MHKDTLVPGTTPKSERQATLLRIVRARPVATQSELVRRLHEAGVECTQASVSRDLRELGLVKRAGTYLAPEAAAVPDIDDFARKIGGFLRSATAVGDHLVVIHALPGTAHGIGVYLDGVARPGVVGTVAGDDTLFVAVADVAAGRSLIERLERIMEESE